MSALTGRARDAVPAQPRIRGLLPGDLVAGKYRVDRALGAGGMGVVVVATDVHLERQVAIKAMNPMLAADERAVERFLREARAAVRLSGDHTVRVYDVGELPSGVPYIAMEFLNGRDLATLAAERGRLASREAVDLLLQAAEGIAEAHVAGIIHRDLKPANLFLSRRSDGSPLVKVLDFGLAKAPVGEGTNLTSPSAVMGTHHYMSPEQLRGSHDVDERTDIWALGVCLYELLTGKMPFRPPSSRDRRPARAALEDLSRMIVFGDPKPAHEVVADVPLGLSDVIVRCLQKNRDERFSTVAELAAALEPYASLEARGSAARIERVLEEDTVITGDVVLKAVRRAPPDSTTEKIQQPAVRRCVDRLGLAQRAVHVAALALVLFVRQLVDRVHHAMRARAAYVWATLAENTEHVFLRVVGAARTALSISIARMRAPRAWPILAVTMLLVGATCLLIAFVSWMAKHESRAEVLPTPTVLPADPSPPIASGKPEDDSVSVDDLPPAPKVEPPRDVRPPPVAPQPQRLSPRSTARPVPSAPSTSAPPARSAAPAPTSPRDSCSTRGYWNAQGIWKWKPECL